MMRPQTCDKEDKNERELYNWLLLVIPDLGEVLLVVLTLAIKSSSEAGFVFLFSGVEDFLPIRRSKAEEAFVFVDLDGLSRSVEYNNVGNGNMTKTYTFTYIQNFKIMSLHIYFIEVEA